MYSPGYFLILTILIQYNNSLLKFQLFTFFQRSTYFLNSKSRAMTPISFSTLSLSNKSHFLWSDGELICIKREMNGIAMLYVVFGFYVEVVFTHNLQQIEQINVLATSRQLSRYLDQISLPDFFQTEM